MSLTSRRAPGTNRASPQAALPWYVYILRCSDDTLYTGITIDLERRMAQHNSGMAARYTRVRLPVVLVYHEEAVSRSAATRRETEIKRLSRAEKMRLVATRRG